jgi:N-methylhydantoinase B
MSEPVAIDSITASVVQGALENIAVEMGYKLMRMSYSSIIRESEDFGAALVDAEGRGLAAPVTGQMSPSRCRSFTTGSW